MNSKETFSVVMLSPHAVVWEGSVLSLSSHNSEGVFDIFPDHARFMTLLRGVSLTLVLPNEETKTLPLTEAVLFFENGKATVYVHEAISV